MLERLNELPSSDAPPHAKHYFGHHFASRFSPRADRWLAALGTAERICDRGICALLLRVGFDRLKRHELVRAHGYQP